MLRTDAIASTAPLQEYETPIIRHRLEWVISGMTWSSGPGRFEADADFVPHALTDGAALRFHFVAPAATMNALLVQFGTFCRRNAGGLVCNIRGSGGNVIRSARSDLSVLVDNHFHPVLSLRGLRFGVGKRYEVELTARCAAGHEVAVYVLASRPSLEPTHEGRPHFSLDGWGAHMAAQAACLSYIGKADRRHRSASLALGDRVVICTHGLPPGGAERQWVYLAIGLAQAGYEVQFVLYDEPFGENAHYLPLLKAAGIPLRFLQRAPPSAIEKALTENPILIRALQARVLPDANLLVRFQLMFAELKPKAVYAQLDDTNLYAGFGALLADVPNIVVSFRSYNPTHFPFIHQSWHHRAYSLLLHSTRVSLTGNSRAANRDYAKWLGVSEASVAFIQNAISLQHFPRPSLEQQEACRKELALAPDHKLVLGVFRLSAEKAPHDFIEVCAMLQARYPGLHVYIIGVGPLLPVLEEHVVARGLGSTIRFLGVRHDVNVLMSIADILLLTSHKEGMPNVVLEAQAMGLPVIATDTGGIRDALLPGNAGVICPVGDIHRLYEACAAYLKTAGAERETRTHGPSTVFGVDLMARRYVQAADANRARKRPYDTARGSQHTGPLRRLAMALNPRRF